MRADVAVFILRVVRGGRVDERNLRPLPKQFLGYKIAGLEPPAFIANPIALFSLLFMMVCKLRAQGVVCFALDLCLQRAFQCAGLDRLFQAGALLAEISPLPLARPVVGQHDRAFRRAHNAHKLLLVLHLPAGDAHPHWNFLSQALRLAFALFVFAIESVHGLLRLRLTLDVDLPAGQLRGKAGILPFFADCK